MYATGWRPDFGDQRDLLYIPLSSTQILNNIDLRKDQPTAPYDQLHIGSCTGQGVRRALEFVRKEQGLPHVNLSSLHLYLSARKLENTVQWDAGAMIRNAIKGAAKWGATTEDLWPYNPSNFRLTPGTDALEEAKKYRAVSYRRVPRNINCIHSALMERNLVVFGIMLYESFHDDKVVSTGMIKMPKSTEAPIGGHAVVGVGYDRISRTIICPNSWGTSWGDEGYFYLPEAYVLNSDLSDDFWIIRLATPKERN